MPRKQKSNESASRYARAMSRMGAALYRYNYIVGVQTARLCKRVFRALRRGLAPVTQWCSGLWNRGVTQPLRRRQERLRQFHSRFPLAWKELKAASKQSFFKIFPCFGNLVRRACAHYRDELLGIWSLVGPTLATVILLVTVVAWSNTDFCLSLTYQDEQLGYIDSETTYAEAATMAKQRVVNVDNSFSVEAVPQLAITLQRDNALMDGTELCDAILRTAGDSIAEAVGLYVNDSFVGAMESNDELQAVLDGIKGGYFDKNDKNQRAEFIQDVKTVEGLFPAATVIEGDAMKAKLTAEAVVRKTYTVQAGDTLSTIAIRNDMTTAALRSMNTAYANTDMVHIGDVLTVQRPQPYLQVKVIRTIQYEEKIDYATQYVNNNNKPVTYSVVKTKGQEGSRSVVAEVTYVDGVEEGRKVVSSTVTKQPVTKVVERGTKKVVSSSGTVVVPGDGITTGSMAWPVPICHNMSRGFSAGHKALDICNGPVTVRNKPAMAADGGRVIYAGWYYGYGNFVKIEHANGLVTAYGHLNSISVVVGQTVSRQQQIGLIGSTGNSSGPHLHFEVIKNGVRVNPLNYVSP